MDFLIWLILALALGGSSAAVIYCWIRFRDKLARGRYNAMLQEEARIRFVKTNPLTFHRIHNYPRSLQVGLRRRKGEPA